MTILELFVYNQVKKHPWLKDLLRNVYQGLWDLLPREKENLSGAQCKEGYFLGFHDIQPFSVDGTKILAQHASFDGRMPQEGDLLDIGYFDFINNQMGDFHKIGESSAWSWHKGCRLQWVDATHLIYNTQYDGQPVAMLHNIETQHTQTLNTAIDSISSDGLWATTLSYERVEKLMPGYGYLRVLDNGYCNQPAPEQTGLFLYSMVNGQKKLILSLYELAKDCSTETNRFHYVTHTAFSKDGRYISCLHRHVSLSDLDNRQTRLIIYDRLTNKHFALPTNGMVSHYVWNANNQIIAYCRIQDKDCHVLFAINNGDCIEWRRIAPQKLNSDGHQTWLSDTMFITDTYPDKRRMAKLWAVNIKTDEVLQIANIYSPKEFQTHNMYCHIACDLHPRASHDGKHICFDSPSTGNRSLYICAINNFITK